MLRLTVLFAVLSGAAIAYPSSAGVAFPDYVSQGAAGSVWSHRSQFGGKVNRRSSQAFNTTLAVYLMRVSIITYMPRSSRIKSMTCLACTDKSMQYLSVSNVYDGSFDMRAVLAYDSQLHAVVVAFRGSASITNWIQNFKVNLVDADDVFPGSSSRGVEVHRGFLEDYEAIRSDVLQGVRSLLSVHPGAKLIVTGHSLGGAMATICAPDMVNSFPNVRNIVMYNFGSPRVGNPAFVDYYSERVKTSFRVTHPFDPVTKVPFRISGYKHVPLGVRDPISRSSLLHPLKSHLIYMGQFNPLKSSGRRRKARQAGLRMRRFTRA